MKRLLFLIPLVAAVSGCSQNHKVRSCAVNPDSLRARFGRHLIFFGNYADSVPGLVNDSLLFPGGVSFYPSADSESYRSGEKEMAGTMASAICEGRIDTNYLVKWCALSTRLAVEHYSDSFTLDGYIAFLATDSTTAFWLFPNVTAVKNIESLTENELEQIWFRSINRILALPPEETELFFQRLKRWDFLAFRFR